MVSSGTANNTPLGMTQAQNVAVVRRDQLRQQAVSSFNETKKQLSEVYKQAKKTAVDKQAEKQAEEAYKEAIREANKACDAKIDLACARFLATWEYGGWDLDGKKFEHAATAGIDEAAKRLDEAIARASKTYDYAVSQAEMTYKEAKKTAVDKQAKKQAEEAYKQATKQAEKVRDATFDEILEVFRTVWQQAKKEEANKTVKAVQERAINKQAVSRPVLQNK
jgi:hypothetical protein